MGAVPECRGDFPLLRPQSRAWHGGPGSPGEGKPAQPRARARGRRGRLALRPRPPRARAPGPGRFWLGLRPRVAQGVTSCRRWGGLVRPVVWPRAGHLSGRPPSPCSRARARAARSQRAPAEPLPESRPPGSPTSSRGREGLPDPTPAPESGPGARGARDQAWHADAWAH